MGQTRVNEFVEIVKSGWHVVIGTRPNPDQIESMRIAESANPNSYVDVAVSNGAVDDSEVWKAAKFLQHVEVKRASDRRAQLWLSAVPFDAARPGPIPEGLHWKSETDGSLTLTDDHGTELGRIEKGVSMAEKQDIVVDALANRAAEGLISSHSRILPASSSLMKETAAMTDADVDTAVGELSRMPAGDQLLGADLFVKDDSSSSEIDSLKRGLAFLRLSDLEDGISDVLRNKGILPRKSVSTADVEKICEKNQFKFELAAPQDPTTNKNRVGYRIVDPNNDRELVAAGKLAVDLLTKRPYFKDKHLRALRDQIGDKMRLRNAVESEISEDQLSELDAAEEEVNKFVEMEGKADPDKDRDKENPGSDPDSTNEGR